MWFDTTFRTWTHERDLRPLPTGQVPPQERPRRAGDCRAREGEAPRPGEGVDPRGARAGVPAHPPLVGGRGGVPRDARARPDGRLGALRPRARPREAGQGPRGERSLQARELDAPRQARLRVADQRPELRAVVQRVSRASSTPGGAIDAGLLVLLGVAEGDTEADAERLAGKIARLRIFEDDAGRFDRSLLDTGGSALVVSQFTLIAETERGNRPSFSHAARPESAEPIYEHFGAALGELGVHVETGVFGARMRVELANDGPVTIVLDVEPRLISAGRRATIL